MTVRNQQQTKQTKKQTNLWLWPGRLSFKFDEVVVFLISVNWVKCLKMTGWVFQRLETTGTRSKEIQEQKSKMDVTLLLSSREMFGDLGRNILQDFNLDWTWVLSCNHPNLITKPIYYYILIFHNLYQHFNGTHNSYD